MTCPCCKSLQRLYTIKARGVVVFWLCLWCGFKAWQREVYRVIQRHSEVSP